MGGQECMLCRAVLSFQLLPWRCCHFVLLMWIQHTWQFRPAAYLPDAACCPPACLPPAAPRCRYLETASGHHWLAQRVPDDSVFVTANQGRFQVRRQQAQECRPRQQAAGWWGPLWRGAFERQLVAALLPCSQSWLPPPPNPQLSPWLPSPADSPSCLLTCLPPLPACLPPSLLQEFDLSDSANVLASPGLERFAASAGLWDPSSGQPLNFFQAFMREGPQDTNYSHPRICYMQHALAGVPAQPCGAEALARPAFLPAARPLGLEDVAGVMRNHWDGGSHDPYAQRNPDETWRPIALLRTGDAHIIRLRPTATPSGRPTGVPPGLAVINYVALGMSSLCPFIPVYAGLPPKELPRELAGAGPLPDPAWATLFWKARRLQALVMQDWPALGPQAEEVIRQFGQRMAQMPQKLMEARYMSALGLGDQAWATRELVAFTAAEVAQAGHTLDWLASQAAEALGLPGLPDADRLVQMLDEAAEAYAFEPTSDSDPAAAAAAAAAAAQPGAGRISLPLRRDSSGDAAPQRQEQ